MSYESKIFVISYSIHQGHDERQEEAEKLADNLEEALKELVGQDQYKPISAWLV